MPRHLAKGAGYSEMAEGEEIAGPRTEQPPQACAIDWGW